MSRSEMTEGSGGMHRERHVVQVSGVATGKRTGSLSGFRSSRRDGLVPGIAHHEEAGPVKEAFRGGPSTNVYRGIKPGENGIDHAFARGFSAFDIHMAELFPDILPLDNLLDRRIDQAQQGDRNAVVVDLGAGVGNVTRQALTEPDIMPLARRKLGRQGATATNLLFYSVTDAETPEAHLRQTPFPEAGAHGNERIQATEVHYSLTSTQTVEKLAEELDIDTADVVTASNFMSYLPLQVFEGVTEDVINLLPSGGEFRVFSYASFSGSRLSIDDGKAEEDYSVTFRNPYDTRGPNFTGDAIRKMGQEILDDDSITDEQINRALGFIYDSIFASTNYQESFQDAMAKDLAKSIKAFGSRLVLKHTLQSVLVNAENQIRTAEIKRAKDEILDNLLKKYDGKITLERNEVDLLSYDNPHVWERLDGFVIKKL